MKEGGRGEVKLTLPYSHYSLSFASGFLVLYLLLFGNESFIEKISFEMVLHNNLLNPGYSDPCFNLLSIRKFGTLFEEKNLFINEWTFPDSHFKLIYGAESYFRIFKDFPYFSLWFDCIGCVIPIFFFEQFTVMIL